ncbi:phage tail assembly chaperone [Pararhodobacter sp.]|uniref:phage tail assembly chaperone n=1 Tax=Pararhodobacter sp. TaxID=2127056 RepID=UPI003A599A01
MTRPSGLDWPGLLSAGLHGLGLKPAEFWALTPIELMLMLGRDQTAEGSFTRDRLEALLRQFPDQTAPQKTETDDGGNGRTGRATGRAGSTDGGDLGYGVEPRFRSCRHGAQPDRDKP